MEIVMDEDRLTPYEVVLFFQSCLNQAGNSIVFESELLTQLSHAKRLVAACKCNRRQIQAVIRVYCSDEWWVRNQPSLHQVIKHLDNLKAKAKGMATYAMTWEEL